MNKRVTLKLYEGSLTEGFSVILQMGDEGKSPVLELSGRLPASPVLSKQYQQWQTAYRQQDPLHSPHRIKAVETGLPTNVAMVEDCHRLSAQLGETFNTWLRSALFRPVRDKLLERLQPNETTQLILQTQDTTVQRLPWHLWEICSRYPALEIALSAPVYESADISAVSSRDRVRILAIFGNDKDLDTATDRTLLKALPHAEIQYLQEPDRPTLDACLWDQKGWDILFFAGHSATPEGVGELSINRNDTITIAQLKHSLRKAVSRGLKIAIFNSCDGVGLAQSLADLRLSQIIVMREVVSDRVAHTFLKSFLAAFSRGEALYLAVREAREKLYALEDIFPCASWLPIIYHNPADLSPHWQDLSTQNLPDQAISTQALSSQAMLQPAEGSPSRRLSRLLLSQLGVVIALLGIQSFGWFQGWELKMFDQLMRLREKENRDPRIVVVEVTEDDVRSQPGADTRRGSLSDKALLAALTTLETLKPRLIGLDIYRDFPVRADEPMLKTALAEMDNLIMVCEGSDESINKAGISPPQGVPPDRVGFIDAVTDPDGVLRRQLFYITQAASSPCQSSVNLSALLALRYLAADGINFDEESLQLGKTMLTPLEANDGGYHNIYAEGYQLLLNYRNLDDPADIAERVTLAELLSGNVSEAAFLDRIVLIGTTASSFKDALPTPYSRGLTTENQTSGVFLQAHMISQLLSAALGERALLRTWPQWGEILWLLVWIGAGGVIAFSWNRQNSQRTANGRILLALLSAELGLLGLCWLLLAKAHYWVPWVPAAIAPVAVVVTDKFVVDR
ncbi:MAG: CHASE2 domain-containing protein [Cyanobacteria bacterium P01_D01_bin.105]